MPYLHPCKVIDNFDKQASYEAAVNENLTMALPLRINHRQLVCRKEQSHQQE